jgi:hypothetical protein
VIGKSGLATDWIQEIRKRICYRYLTIDAEQAQSVSAGKMPFGPSKPKACQRIAGG